MFDSDLGNLLAGGLLDAIASGGKIGVVNDTRSMVLVIMLHSLVRFIVFTPLYVYLMDHKLYILDML